jgi:hypothetical protein
LFFGDTSTFGIKATSVSESGDFGEVYLWLNAEQIGMPPDVLPVFVTWLEILRRFHEAACPTSVDCSDFTDREVYELLDRMRNGSEVDGIEEYWFWNYHFIHNLTDALNWYKVFIVDQGQDKRIVWKAIASPYTPRHHSEKVWGAMVTRREFNETLVSFFDWYTSKFPGKISI